MTKISSYLRNEHKLIDLYMEKLNIGAQKLERNENISFTLLESYIKFFREYCIGYHMKKEEDELFKTLERIGIFHEDLPLEEILHDHRTIRTYLNGIEKLFADFKDDQPSNKKRLAKYMTKFVNLLRCHSRREDRVLYPMADRMMNEGERERVFEYFSQKEDENREMLLKYREMINA